MSAPRHPVPPSRREFLSRVAVAAAAPLVLGTVGRAADVVEQSSPVGGGSPGGASRASCVHVFSKPLQPYSYAETAGMIAEAGFGGIDLTVRKGGHVVPERVREDLPKAVEAARAAGLKVEMITTGVVDARDPHTLPLLETAAALGVKYYRLGWINYDFKKGVRETLAALKPVFRELAELNKAFRLHGAYQNHAGVMVGGAVWDIYELVRDLDPRWIGCQYDIRHAVVEGSQSWPVGMRLLHPWIRCTDMKDFRWVTDAGGKVAPQTVPLGEGVVDFPQYFALVRELGIGGPISVHFEYPPLEGAAQGVTGGDKRRAFVEAMRKDGERLERLMASAA